jgi:low affinity Fe/Cu permease
MSSNKQQSGDSPERLFSRFASFSAGVVGSPFMFLFALLTIVAWIITGPIFHYSDAWQLIINSWTNVVTFIVVFLIQNAQNRDSKAINLKLDELIRSVEHARNDMINIEQLSDKELQGLAERYERIRQEWDERRHGLDKRHDPAA